MLGGKNIYRTLPLGSFALAALLAGAAVCKGSAVDPDALAWVIDNTAANLAYVIDPPPETNVISRDLTNGALAALLLGDGAPFGPNGTTLTPNSPPCVTALELLHAFGERYDMSFGGQPIPTIYHNYLACFNDTERAWFLGAMNASLPQTVAEATPQEVSYTNMYLMAAVEAVLFGEIFAGEPRGDAAAAVGYGMLNDWVAYSATAAVHEFNSPTYTYVQLSALYTGYIHTTSDAARAQIGWALDLIWATTAANAFAGALSGPHSRDYDTLLGHGLLMVEMYLHGLPDSGPLACEYKDPHCEGAPDSAVAGTLEPSTVICLSWWNAVHPDGYRVKPEHLALASLGPTREVRYSFLAQAATANGNERRFAEAYNFVAEGAYALGSSSQDYVTNTHSKYFPCPQSQPVRAVLGDAAAHARIKTRIKARAKVGGEAMAVAGAGRPGSIPAVTLQPDWMDSPYGIWEDYGEWAWLGKGSHLALHPGAAQAGPSLLVDLALNGNDALDGFTLTPDGNLYPGLSTSAILPLFADEVVIATSDDDGTDGGGAAAIVVRPFAVPSKPFEEELAVGSTVGMRVGRGALAVRVFGADQVDPATGAVAVGGDGEVLSARLVLKGDGSGMDLGAMRLVAYHMEQFPPGQGVFITASHVAYHALIVADVCDADNDDAAANSCLEALAERVAAAQCHANTSSVADNSGAESFTVRFVACAVGPKPSPLRSPPELAVGSSAGGGEADGAAVLEVWRNLTCSEGGRHNQTAATSWNCLVARAVNGESARPPALLVVNGETVVGPPPKTPPAANVQYRGAH